ncbi:spore germination protein [Anaerofustis sp.]|uniref:spore germination protein n=1 Tax=Anaerofustis sp. TaxID=1872517 RepID=UPI0025BD884D|nr:spore germination protein [Anaerofustis sp.]
MKNLYKSLKLNTVFIKNQFNNDDTIRYRNFNNKGIDYLLLFIDGMSNNERINEDIIKAILENKKYVFKFNILKKLKDKILFANTIKELNTFEDIFSDLLYGNTILLIEGQNKALSIDTKGFTLRAIQEPPNEKITKGPREGFGENILTNLSLLRRKIQSPNLKLEFSAIGNITQTKICLAYVDGIVDKKVLKELKKRLKKIDIDSVLDTNYIMESIKDDKFSPFKTTGTFEKPDVVASKILEGRVALFVDGTPIVMTVPYLFIENFMSGDDYYLNYYFASFTRLIRIISFFLSISIPALFIAIITFHKEVLPSNLAISIIGAREGIPCSSLMECILMIITFEILGEAGNRSGIGASTALGIVGGIVVGQAAVEARLISAPMIIIVALSAISELMIPMTKGATIIFRFLFIILSSVLGLYGFTIALLIMLVHLSGLESFGMSYMANVVYNSVQQFKDSFYRAPWFKMLTRPTDMSKKTNRTNKNEQT